MMEPVLKAFQILDRQATIADVREASRQLFLCSSQYTSAFMQPFSAAEVDAVASAIYDYILDPHYLVDPKCPCREIVFEAPRPFQEAALEYAEFAAMFSSDMLYQSCPYDFPSLDHDGLVHALKTFLVGILYRYRYCVSGDQAAFPMSMILRYMTVVKELFLQEEREHELSEALWITLRALRAVELSYGFDDPFPEQD